MILYPSTEYATQDLDALAIADLPALSLLFDPLSVTFQLSSREPLHRWYSLLEGFSPSFVRQALERFAPTAKRVLDPFAGTGTGPLVVGELGIESLYCEINPLLQHIAAVKSQAYSLSTKQKVLHAKKLRELSARLSSELNSHSPDVLLQQTFTTTFGSSRFFDGETYGLVLRARSLIDDIACTEPFLADLVSTSILASLIKSSLLQRAGDLRYKRAQELARKCDFVVCSQEKLNGIADDLESLELTPNFTKPVLVLEDARNLRRLPYLNIDTVITSPPYLNGTNYFRNTKIELWFLRCLASPRDLAQFRERSITAGINDVTGLKVGISDCEEVATIVSELRTKAYDPRIPKMVTSYFHDLGEVFSGVKGHLREEAKLLIDIGDSQYAGVHIKTNALLIEVLRSLGFTFVDEVYLRDRMSRNGFGLSESLLVFKYAKPHDKKAVGISPPRQKPWSSPWESFKSCIPHQRHPFAKRNWGHPLHSLCSYQGKMKPSLAYHLVKTFVPEGGTLLDPFAGVGTIPFEGALNGVRSYGFEISPAAWAIAKAKVMRPDKEDCYTLLERIKQTLTCRELSESDFASAAAMRFNSGLPEYFNHDTLREILLVRRFFKENPPQSPAECLVFSSLLHILHGNRPYALSRRSHPITPFAPTGPSEYRSLLRNLTRKVERSLAVYYPHDFVDGQILFQDALSWWPTEIDNLDAVITSPPFFDSTRFYLANWMRLWFCGWESRDFQSKPLRFVDELQKTTFDVYQAVFRQTRERLKPGGVVVLHLGKSHKADMATSLAKVAAPWFQVEDLWAENVDHCESHGITDKGTVREHQYLILT